MVFQVFCGWFFSWFLGLFFGLFWGFYRLASLFSLPLGKGAFFGSECLVLVGRFSALFQQVQYGFFSKRFLKYSLLRSIFFGAFFILASQEKGAFFHRFAVCSFYSAKGGTGAFYWRLCRHRTFFTSVLFRVVSVVFRSVLSACSARFFRLAHLDDFRPEHANFRD